MKSFALLVLTLALFASAAQAKNPEAVTLLGTAPAQAQTGALKVAFDDEGFGYYGLAEGVIQLEHADGILTFRLVEIANPHGVTHAFAPVARLSRAEYNHIYREPGFGLSMTDPHPRTLQAEEALRLRRHIGLEERADGLRLRHQDAEFGATMAYYLETLAGFGFAITPLEQLPSVRAYTLGQGAEHARLVFIRSGNDVIVNLSGAAR